MISQPVKIQPIELSLLYPHPQNANVMPAEVMAKLRRHIAASGRYEPLVVRPHPRIAGAFELINGHHRKEILASLGHAAAQCVVWELTDSEALLLLATINRLGGEDAAGKRLSLLDSLSQAMAVSAAELARYLPESEATLTKLLAQTPAPVCDAPPLEQMPEAFTVFLQAGEKRELLARLKETHRDPAVALLCWARERVACGKAGG